jgi:prepilin-type N-terminal cleavage/methylation domain-containing protein
MLVKNCKKAFTLIEVLIAMTLLGLIVSQGLYLLSQQIKNRVKYKKVFESFQAKEFFLEQIQGYFFHLVTSEKKCLEAGDQGVCIYFDAGVTLDPELSGPIKANLKLDGDTLKLIVLLENNRSCEQVILSGVKTFKLQFFSQDTLWQQSWASESQGLPEMMHVQLNAESLSCDQKFLLPFNLPPISVSCKSSPLSLL